ncbi:arginyltransferase [Dasania sp. GY-MA-18]|uniref:Aspartate/glutamate leucyltransferase n=1 Tax=Dasania phycosphaerae TaxID=2950436 RepID=A0A9J6RIK1_9GAMM|nr:MULTISPECIES: arginyltransferase [Dasania]MCR8921832.1 arginyltransferase [Dasania sp. GY-MA-18]MCZ0864260.1 arginyltransferase [Dasania phycosphaerae]MCZ0867988.1 arginyltransferase [Dasania phycosphaerae]
MSNRELINLEQLKFYSTREHPCSYLPQELATTLFLDPEQKVEQPLYSALSDFGFRRSGNNIYRPHCASCQQCISIRIPCQSFCPSRQQRRIHKRNADLQCQEVSSIDNDECYALFEKYINLRHADGDMYPTSRPDYVNFLCTPNNYSRYFTFRLKEQLIAVALADQLEQGLSAVYSFFDPDHDKRSLGTYMILWQLEECSRLGLHALYLGYWIKNCQKMRYKSAFRPLELYINQQWLQLN